MKPIAHAFRPGIGFTCIRVFPRTPSPRPAQPRVGIAKCAASPTR
ncbi:hypothetical protein M2162_000001, partial [Streptomyces sp. SAI-041]|nr:hypothetical protein [Streptomyces sp. SAI-041]